MRTNLVTRITSVVTPQKMAPPIPHQIADPCLFRECDIAMLLKHKHDPGKCQHHAQDLRAAQPFRRYQHMDAGGHHKRRQVDEHDHARGGGEGEPPIDQRKLQRKQRARHHTRSPGAIAVKHRDALGPHPEE